MTRRKNFIRGQCVFFLFVLMLFAVGCVGTEASSDIGITAIKSQVEKCEMDRCFDSLKDFVGSTTDKEQLLVKRYTNNAVSKLTIERPFEDQRFEGFDNSGSSPAVDPGDNTDIHIHSYSVLATTAPGCMVDGYTVYGCDCGDTYKSDIITAQGHTWSNWTTIIEPSVSAAGKQSRTCSVCSTSETKAIAKLPSESNTEPDECHHNWQVKYYPEVGHYGDYYNVCKCGWRFNDPSEWAEHVKNAGGDAVIYHTNWGSNQDYIVDSPERYEWYCSICGEVTTTEP